jgi:hypothetical protein
MGWLSWLFGRTSKKVPLEPSPAVEGLRNATQEASASFDAGEPGKELDALQFQIASEAEVFVRWLGRQHQDAGKIDPSVISSAVTTFATTFDVDQLVPPLYSEVYSRNPKYWADAIGKRIDRHMSALMTAGHKVRCRRCARNYEIAVDSFLVASGSIRFEVQKPIWLCGRVESAQDDSLKKVKLISLSSFQIAAMLLNGAARSGRSDVSVFICWTCGSCGEAGNPFPRGWAAERAALHF